MQRRIKKIVYGVFWNALLLGIVILVYITWLVPKPSCTDGIQNQNETGVDCGGSCTACSLKHLEQMRVVQPPEIFSLSSGKARSPWWVVCVWSGLPAR